MELLDAQFRTNMINILRVLMEKVDNMQEWMDNISRDENSKKIKNKCWSSFFFF
jgi:hypothetical protein